jgi:hypothetical protein
LKLEINPSDYGRAIYEWYDPAPHIREVEKHILDLFDGNNNNLILSIPIRHGKTMYACRLLPFALMLQNPLEKIIVAAGSMSNAVENVSAVRDLLIQYGSEAGIQIDQSFSQKHYFRTVQGGEVRAVSVGSSFNFATGYTLIVDDVYCDQQQANSPTQRRNVETWFMATLLARRTPNPYHPPKTILIGSPRHPEGLELALEASNPDLDPSEQWVIHRLPAIKPDGNPLWDHFPIEKLMAIKQQYESLGQGYLFDTLYLCNPKVNPLGGWPTDYTQDLFYDNTPELTSHYKVMAVDANVGCGAKPGDFGCVLYGLYDKNNGNLYIEDCYLSRNSYDQLEDKTVEMLLQYNPDGCLIESNNAFRVIADNIINKAKRGMAFPPVYLKTSTENKNQRIDTMLSPLLAQKKLKLKNISGNRLGLNQMKSWPSGENDDYPDTIYLLTQMIATLLRK